ADLVRRRRILLPRLAHPRGQVSISRHSGSGLDSGDSGIRSRNWRSPGSGLTPRRAGTTPAARIMMTRRTPTRIRAMSPRQTLPPDIEEIRDFTWRRQGDRQVDSPADAERFIDEVGFAACLTDSRRPGPSLYVAVCGRRDAVLPRNVQKAPEASRTWLLKDELVRRGKVYYGKLGRGKAMFIAPRMIEDRKSVV